MNWVKAATGSLGQGLSIGVGLALGQKLGRSPGRTFVLLGDGECAEGSVWEAANAAVHFGLKESSGGRGHQPAGPIRGDHARS